MYIYIPSRLMFLIARSKWDCRFKLQGERNRTGRMATPNSLFSSHGSEAINIVIVGGGVAGLATALALHRIGLKSLVLESSDSLRTTGAAFTIWANGWKALDALGVADTLRPNYCQLQGIRGCSSSSGVQKDVQFIKERTGGRGMNTSVECRCIGRQALLETLAKALPDGSIRFNSKLVSIHKKGGSPFTTLELADGTSITAKIVIGCDGVHSAVAEWMGLEAAKPLARVAMRGMAKCPQRYHATEKRMVQIWGEGVRGGIIPCTDKQLYWFITRKSQPQDAGHVSRDTESLRRAMLEAVRDFPEPIGELIKSSPADTLSMADLKWRWLWPWEWDRMAKGKGSVTVVGDALHPMTPDMGQGACSALEDAVVLARCLSVSNIINLEEDREMWGEEEERMIQECFQQYWAARKWRVFSVVTVAFVAGLVLDGSSSFLRFVRDWIWLPFFSMSHLPYFASSYDCGTLPPQYADKLPFPSTSASESSHAHNL